MNGEAVSIGSLAPTGEDIAEVRDDFDTLKAAGTQVDSAIRGLLQAAVGEVDEAIRVGNVEQVQRCVRAAIAAVRVGIPLRVAEYARGHSTPVGLAVLAPSGVDVAAMAQRFAGLHPDRDEAIRATLRQLAEALDDAVSASDVDGFRLAVRELVAVARAAHPHRAERGPERVPDLPDPATCQHGQAFVVATAGGDGQVWEPLNPNRHDYDDLRVVVSAGTCAECGEQVATVRMWNPTTWTPEHGPAWSTRWAPLTLDGGGAR